MDLTVVIPIFNASRMIGPCLQQLDRALTVLNRTYEILLADDGSSDGSGQILRDIQASYPSIRCLFNPGNQGLGRTLRNLFGAAQGELILYLDVDLPFGAGILDRFLAEAQNADIAVASRYRGGQNSLPWPRKIASLLYYEVCRLMFGIRVRDIGSGMVAVKKAALAALDLRAEGFDIHIELFAKAQRHGLVIQETSFDSGPFQAGSFSLIRHGPPVLGKTLRLWWELRKTKELCKPKEKKTIPSGSAAV